MTWDGQKAYAKADEILEAFGADLAFVMVANCGDDGKVRHTIAMTPGSTEWNTQRLLALAEALRNAAVDCERDAAKVAQHGPYWNKQDKH